ncbi:MAG TPA: ABC transporter permease [Polyangiaceae bacterium]|nr:ABC transporter permease [Polyangiaceae bacterium]
MSELLLLVGSSIDSGTPLLLAALGLIINERSGVINLGAEGLMLIAAITGFATAVATKNDAVALLAGAGAAALFAAFFGFLVIWLNANQYATGLSLSLFGAGFSAFVGIGYTQESLTLARHHGFWSHHYLVYVAVLLTLGLSWFLFRSKAGLVLRAVGESPESAQALGYPVRLIRLAAVISGGALVGLAGAFVSVVSTPLWVEGMIAGKGWIALALTTFATWRPGRALLGAYLFGGVTMLQLHLQGRGVNLPVELLTALPYLATIFVLVLISRNPRWIAANMPTSLGKPFYPGA